MHDMACRDHGNTMPLVMLLPSRANIDAGLVVHASSQAAQFQRLLVSYEIWSE